MSSPTLALILAISVAAAQDPLELLSVTPAGEDVPPGRQIVFQFDRPVVPIGRMDRDPSEISITIEPPLECEWRWISTSALACQLGEDGAMVPATTYVLNVAAKKEVCPGCGLGWHNGNGMVDGFETKDVKWNITHEHPAEGGHAH